MTLRGGVGQLVKLESENGALKREMVQQRQQMAVMADNLAYLQKRQVRARVAWRDGVLSVLRGDTKRCSRRRAARALHMPATQRATHPSRGTPPSLGSLVLTAHRPIAWRGAELRGVAGACGAAFVSLCRSARRSTRSS